MKDLGVVQLLLLAVFLLAPLLRFVITRARTPVERAPSADEAALATRRPGPPPRAARVPPAAPRPDSLAGPGATATSGGRRWPSRARPGPALEVRRGMVLMTILGPCRAADSPGSRSV